MRIGIIARCDNTGLGIQSKEFFDNIPCKALVVDVSKIAGAMPQNHHWYPGQDFFIYQKGVKFPPNLIQRFLSQIDVLVAFETAYDHSLFQLCRDAGVFSILQLNYELLDYPSSLPPPDIFAAPSMWNYENIPDPKVFLPVPVNTNKIKVQERAIGKFLHLGGKPAEQDRNGTKVFLNCLKYVKNNISVKVRCHEPLGFFNVPGNVNLEILDSNVCPDYSVLCDGGVLVMPRKFGGLSLPVNESLASGMPVIMTDISPNNTWLPQEWLVPARLSGQFMSRKMIDVYEANLIELAKKIDQFCEQQFYDTAVDKALELGKLLSWEFLKQRYYDIFSSLVNTRG